MNKISQLIRFVRLLLTPSVASIVAKFDKIEAKIEQTIKKAHADLDATNKVLTNLQSKVAKGNGDLDAAYKLLHSVTNLKG